MENIWFKMCTQISNNKKPPKTTKLSDELSSMIFKDIGIREKALQYRLQKF